MDSAKRHILRRLAWAVIVLLPPVFYAGSYIVLVQRVQFNVIENGQSYTRSKVRYVSDPTKDEFWTRIFQPMHELDRKLRSR